MAARIRKHHQDEVRARIQTSQLINRLQDQADGKVELNPQQMKAIEILLKKALPDLSAIELSGEVTNKTARELSEAEIDERIAALRAGTAAGEEAADRGPEESTPVH